MVERLAVKISEISKGSQTLEGSLRARRRFESLHSRVKSAIRQIDKVSPLSQFQKEAALSYALWTTKPDPEGIANLLGKESEEIEKQIKYVFENENQELETIISRLTEQEKPLSWSRGRPKTITKRVKENVKQLRNKGYTRKAIAEESGIPLSRVKYTIQLLRRDGEIE